MPTIPAGPKETSIEYLLRNLRVATDYLPDPSSRHMNGLNRRYLPVDLSGVHCWEDFLRFVFSWQPTDDGTQLKTGNHYSDWSVGLNTDPRDKKIILEEMEKVLFLCHYLQALITNSKLSVAWARLDEDDPGKEGWLDQSSDLLQALHEYNEPNMWKEVQAVCKKMRELHRAIN